MISINKNKIRIFLFSLIMIILIILPLTLTGCQPADYQQLTMKDLRKGSKSLEIRFLKNTPPDIIYENDPAVFISLSVQNLGASDIKQGVLAIGREEDYLSIDKFRFKGQEVKEPVIFDLEGKSLDNPYGEETSLEMDAHTREITLTKYQDSSIRITACYDYQTILEESVCIEPEQFKTQLKTKACKARDFSPSYKGAPVNVKKVSIQSKKISNKKVRNIFRIKVGNDGNGKVITKGIAKEMCSPDSIRGVKGLDYKKAWDIVKIRARIGVSEMACKNNGIIRLEKGKLGETICEVDTDLKGAYVTPLVIQLDYGYTFTVYKNFKIEKI